MSVWVRLTGQEQDQILLSEPLVHERSTVLHFGLNTCCSAHGDPAAADDIDAPAGTAAGASELLHSAFSDVHIPPISATLVCKSLIGMNLSAHASGALWTCPTCTPCRNQMWVLSVLKPCGCLPGGTSTWLPVLAMLTLSRSICWHLMRLARRTPGLVHSYRPGPHTLAGGRPLLAVRPKGAGLLDKESSPGLSISLSIALQRLHLRRC